MKASIRAVEVDWREIERALVVLGNAASEGTFLVAALEEAEDEIDRLSRDSVKLVEARRLIGWVYGRLHVGVAESAWEFDTSEPWTSLERVFR